MSPRLHVEGLIFSVVLLIVATNGRQFQDDSHPGVGDEDVRFTNGGDEAAAIERELLRQQHYLLAKGPKFPKLTTEQRKFATNPGYMSYYNLNFARIEDEQDRIDAARKAKEEEYRAEQEIVEDPFEPADTDTFTNNEEEETISGAYEEAAAAGLDGPTNRKKTGELDERIQHNAQRITMENRRIDRITMEAARIDDIYFTVIVAVSSAVAAFAVIGAGVCYHRLQRNAKATEDVEYPAYGVTGPGKETSPTSGGDRKLAQNAQMYHYQHQKQQMIAFDTHQTASAANRGGLASDDESDDGEEGDYTVYECPGLATTGEMEVRNPMFADDQTPNRAPTAAAAAANNHQQSSSAKSSRNNK